MLERPEGTTKIHVDRALCAGHALCAARAPEVYELDEDGFCISDGKVVGPELARKAWIGARVCPEKAITLSSVDPE
jgi:ferredoxin